MIRISEFPGGFEFGCSIGFAGADRNNDPIAITARHCGPNRPTPAYLGASSTPEGVSVPVSTLAPSALDYAAVRLHRGTRVEPLPISSPPLHIGEQVCKIGRTTGRTCGAIVAITPTALIARIRVAWGDSGGPLIYRGHVIGITSEADASGLPHDPIAAHTTLLASMAGMGTPVDTVFVRADAIVRELEHTIGFHPAV